MARVECQNLFKEFDGPNGSITAVDSVNIVVDEGEFATLVGPSGCGKTTLLRMIAGLETPTSGDIFFDDVRVNEIKPQNRNTSMVFQNVALFPFKTVRDNIRYGLKYTDLDDEQIDQDVQEMAEMVGIDELLDQKPNQLSGGQQQRVALARAIVRDPDVFLLDEPMSDLDAKLKSNMRTELKRLHKEFRQTTLYVTHDQHEALTLATEVIVMNNGRIQQQASPEDVFERPRNLFVAQFIGSPTINTFDATVDGESVSCHEFNHSIQIEEFEHPLRNLSTTSDVILGIRPSSIELVDDQNQAILNGTIEILEKVGNETVLYVDLEDADQEIRVVTAADETLEIGKSIGMGFAPEDLHLFDVETTENLIFKDSEAHAQPIEG